jgi:soluble lytic murein transglycosylase
MRRFRRSLTLAIAVLAVLLATLAWLHSRTTAYDDRIAQAAASNRLDFNLIKALIYEESWFRPDIRGGSGELGLMQVSMAAARDFAAGTGFPIPTEERVLEPALNIEIGSWYLRQSLDHYKDSPAPLVFALVRYNAGDARADYWRRMFMSRPIPPGLSAEEHALSLIDYPKTRAYARRILRRYRSGRIWF